MYRLKIYGAGSIGNHMAHAARQLDWEVVVCDVSDVALERMKNEIYPSRYGAWDPDIQICQKKYAPVGGFDLIHIGTPPKFHIPLALDSLRENPKAILIEKPLCPPTLEQAQELYLLSKNSATRVFVGYDHVVGRATRKADELIKSDSIGEIQTIDVEFREHWGGIFKAHSWLKGPKDSYLGFWQQGGGASGEHSHAVNLWQHFASVVTAGRVAEVDAMMDYVNEGGVNYDRLCMLNLRTEKGLAGRVVQDVITTPPRKRCRIQGRLGAVEWVNNYSPDGDAVISIRPNLRDEVHFIPKKRPEDFIEELRHIEEQLKNTTQSSGIALEKGLDTMLVVAAAHFSEVKKCRVRIDYEKGYSLEALLLYQE